MNFKEQIRKDLSSVFLNLGEFAELHRIEGKQVPVVIDDDELRELKKGQTLDMTEADMLILAKADDLPQDLDPGRLLNVDGREMLVVKAGEDMGLVEVALRQNRSG